MSEIFISYSSEDRQRVIPLVKALEARGWSVWWDRIIPPGKTYYKVIEEALQAAGCLIVLWTRTSVKSDWVRTEAAEGERREILIPALLDDAEIPLEFKRIQAADLIGWRGEADHAGFQELIKAVAGLIGPAGTKSPERKEPAGVPGSAADAEAEPAGDPSLSQAARFEAPAGVTTPWWKKVTVKKSAWVALAFLAVAGGALLLRPDLLKLWKSAGEDPADKSRVVVAVTGEKPPAAEPPAAAPPAPTAVVKVPAAKEEPPPGEPAPREAAPPKPEPATAETPPPKTAVAKPPAEPEKPAPEPRTEPPKPKPAEPEKKIEKPPAAVPKAKPAPAPAPQAKPEQPPAAVPREAPARKTISNSVGMEFVLIPARSEPLTMGSALGIDELAKRFGGSPSLYKGEKPARTVRIGQAFYLQTKPVTQGQWQRVMGANPSSFKDCGAECPVEAVSWDEARQFVARLNQAEAGARYRLPSEAEWEYAARAGSEAEFFFGDDAGRLGEYAWFAANSGARPHPVGGKKPNAWGLFDMIGNVWEWVEDDWHAGYDGAPADGSAWVDAKRAETRVVRGGAWAVIARYCRSAARYYEHPAARKGYVGLRVVRSAG
jgi:formylglycine-generating enzyme required for sulfatase activity